MRFLLVALLSLLFAFVCVGASSSTVSVSVDASTKLHAVSPLLFGIFFEEINHAGQGGLYSQLIDNTNFEYVDFWPWYKSNNSTGMHLSLNTDNPLNLKNRQHLKIAFDSSIQENDDALAITNPGFHGMTFTAGANYKFSIYGYIEAERIQNPSLTITLEDSTGNVVAKSEWSGIGLRSWKKTEFILTPNANVTNGRLSIYFDDSITQPGVSVHLDMISLFPEQGWNGLSFIREDLGQMISDLSPAFIRFPGGCYVEGDTLDHRFNWKESIGDLIQRPGHYDLWDYYSEDGLGYLEYLLFIEKISNAQGKRVEPVWVVNNGVSHADSIPTSNLYQWIQDALDSLEFAMGDVNTKYGAMRAALGHPEPFQINIMAIGNEDCGKPYYTENYKAFYNAIKAKYPNMTCIANCDLTSQGATNELWDYHTYQNAQWFIDNIHQWDRYDRSAAKIFESEYAVTRECGEGNVNAAIAEAAYMTGLERNSDVVSLASYAPLLVNANDKKWMPDAIVFDSYRSYGTPSYWIQSMFSNAQKGTVVNSQYVLSSSVSGGKVAVSSTIADDANNANQQILIIKAVNYDTSNGATINFSVNLPSGKSMKSPAQIQSLHSTNINDENTFDNPTMIAPVNSQQVISNANGAFSINVPAYSAHIIRVTLA